MKILSTIGAVLLLTAITVQAQTNGPLGALWQPFQTIGGYLAANSNAVTATNWTVAPYGSISKDVNGKQIYGGGLAAVWYINPYIGTQIRAQYLDFQATGKPARSLWLPNGTITLQSTYMPFGPGIPITIRPMVEAGAATDLKGNMMAIAGTGGEIDLWNQAPGKGTVVQRISVFGGIEKWQGALGNPTVKQFGLAVNLDLASVIKKLANLKL